MEAILCFEASCMLQGDCMCQCTSLTTYWCKLHFEEHLKSHDKANAFESNFIEPYEGTKEALLKILSEKSSKCRKLKEKIFTIFSKRALNSESNIKDLIKDLDATSDELNNCFSKIMEAEKILETQQDPLLGLLKLQPEEAVEKIKKIIPISPDYYKSAKLFCEFGEKFEKMTESFVKDKFDDHIESRITKIEKDFEENKNSISLANNKLNSLKESISEIISESKKSKQEFEDWKKTIELKLENETKLLNSQAVTATEDLNLQLKEKSEKSSIFSQKIAEIIKQPNNPNIDFDFRKTCSEYEQNTLDESLIQDFQDYINTYQKNSSLYNFGIEDDNRRTNFHIFNTEAETKETKTLYILEPLNAGTCIAQLPSSNLFCYGNKYGSGISVIIDKYYEIQMLPSGVPCRYSSALYFNKSVYCFGGHNSHGGLNLSNRFDLDKNKWFELTAMPIPDFYCNSVIFNENILVSGYENNNLLKYAIDIDSFTTIPYEFACKKRKILINDSDERLYLIECSKGKIHESGFRNEENWREIADSRFSNSPSQMYFSYNKGAVYMGTNDADYFKFELGEKRLTILS